MWIIKFILKWFKKDDTPEAKGTNLGSFNLKLNQHKPYDNSQKNTWTGSYRRR